MKTRSKMKMTCKTTDIKLEMLSCVRTGNGTPHDKLNMRSISHACTNRKYDIFIQRRLRQIFTCILEWGQRTCKKSRPYPARAYTTLVVLVLLITPFFFFCRRILKQTSVVCIGQKDELKIIDTILLQK